MKIAVSVVILIAALVILFATGKTRAAVTCFSTGEQTSGLNKICYYDCSGSTVAINVRSYQLCPLTIRR